MLVAVRFLVTSGGEDLVAGMLAGSSATKDLGSGTGVCTDEGNGGVLGNDLGDDFGGGGGAGSEISAAIIEKRSIWPRGAAEAVIDNFSLSQSLLVTGYFLEITGTGGTAGAPQFTGFRLISVSLESLAVAGAKKLCSMVRRFDAPPARAC